MRHASKVTFDLSAPTVLGYASLNKLHKMCVLILFEPAQQYDE